MIRTKEYTTGDYREIEIFNLSPHKRPFSRARKIKESTPAQKNLNDKKSRKYFRRLLHSNFGKKDLALTLTFDDDNLPENDKDALRMISNFVKSIKRLWNKKYPGRPFRYIYVFSEVAGDGSGEVVRKHFHMVITGGLDRDVIEDKWKHGYCNADRLQFTKDGLEPLAEYMLRQAKGRRRWKGSSNLIKPEALVSDKVLSRSKMEEIRRDPENAELIEKLINRGRKDKWILTKCEIEYDGRELFGSEIDTGEGMGMAILIRMRKA